MPKPPSKAQLWARERNWNKARALGTFYQIKSIMYQDSTISDEMSDFKIASAAFERIIEKWDSNNKVSKPLFMERRTYAKRKRVKA